ncbi:MAG: hypothetical protein NTY14_05110 [Candidatus Omnitrophica bacterium]|nr:hypothetical protein [Candidatus Omnitrophota bacterium]
MKRNLLILIFFVFLAVSFSVLSFAQENQTSQKPAAAQENTAVAPAAPSAPANPADVKPVPTEWLYGEINSVDIPAKALTMTYLDYDTDIEKQATVSIDAKTIFENVKSLEEIKPQDMVSIDYVVGADSKNLAVSISVEKPESAEDLNAEGAAPEEPKQGMKPAVENTAVPAAANSSSEPAKGQ